jgi:hypothetical protein
MMVALGERLEPLAEAVVGDIRPSAWRGNRAQAENDHHGRSRSKQPVHGRAFPIGRDPAQSSLGHTVNSSGKDLLEFTKFINGSVTSLLLMR